MKIKIFNIKKQIMFISLFILILFFSYLFYNIIFTEEGYNKGSNLIKSIDPNDTTFQGVVLESKQVLSIPSINPMINPFINPLIKN